MWVGLLPRIARRQKGERNGCSGVPRCRRSDAPNTLKQSVQGRLRDDLAECLRRPDDAQYAAVWVNRPMPPWSAIHGVTGNAYQAWFNKNVKAGYGASLVSATGSGATRFRRRDGKGVGAGWVAHHGLTATQFNAVNDSAMTSGLRPHSVTIYGDSGSRLYAGVWWPNTDWVKWMVNPGDSAASYQHTFNLCTQLPGYTLNAWRPAYVALSDDHTYCSVYSDDVVDSWYARHGLTAAEYQTEFDNQKKAGRYPICVQGGGSGSDTRYAAVFAKNDVPESRQWTATGQSVAAYQHVDHAAQDLHGKAGDPGGSGGDRQERRDRLRPRVHLGRAGLQDDSAQRSLPARQLQQDVLRGGNSIALSTPRF